MDGPRAPSRCVPARRGNGMSATSRRLGRGERTCVGILAVALVCLTACAPSLDTPGVRQAVSVPAATLTAWPTSPASPTGTGTTSPTAAPPSATSAAGTGALPPNVPGTATPRATSTPGATAVPSTPAPALAGWKTVLDDEFS